jgi:alkylation response protein AidB-like acyl-CoA dehydrogenase
VPGHGIARHGETPAGRPAVIHDIFEGTEQIQQLVISRAISGLRIE